MNARISNQVRRSIYMRDGFRCALCDSTEGLQIHHVVPRGVGGSVDSPMNLICLCWRCHNAAHALLSPARGFFFAYRPQALLRPRRRRWLRPACCCGGYNVVHTKRQVRCNRGAAS